MKILDRVIRYIFPNKISPVDDSFISNIRWKYGIGLFPNITDDDIMLAATNETSELNLATLFKFRCIDAHKHCINRTHNTYALYGISKDMYNRKYKFEYRRIDGHYGALSVVYVEWYDQHV